MKLLKVANEYTKKMDLFDFAFLKICLFSGGVMVGSTIPKKKSKCVFKFSFFIFLFTYCTLMTKFVAMFVKEKEY